LDTAAKTTILADRKRSQWACTFQCCRPERHRAHDRPHRG